MKAKICFFIFCSIIALYQERVLYGSENEGDVFVKAWEYYNQDKTEKAFEIVSKFNKPDSQLRDGWVVLLGSIYLTQKRYEDALNEIGKVRIRLERAYAIIENPAGQTKGTIEVANSIKEQTIFLYYRMLIVTALANFRLDNCKDATHDFEVMYAMEKKGISIERKNDSFDYFLAICFYKLKEYAKATNYFASFYETRTDNKERDSAAYNVGALNALQGKSEEAIRWLIIPLEHDRRTWLEKIKNDKDFDGIRGDKKFKVFLVEQELMLTK